MHFLILKTANPNLSYGPSKSQNLTFLLQLLDITFEIFILQLRKEQQKKERFMGFFSRQPKVDSAKKAVKQVYSFITPFSVQTDMTLAPKPRPPLTSTEVIDQLLVTQDSSITLEDSLKELKRNLPKLEKTKSHEKDIIGKNLYLHEYNYRQLNVFLNVFI